MRNRIFRLCLGLAVSAIAAAIHVSAQESTQLYDVVLDGGRVMDPETGLDAVRNVGIRAITSLVFMLELVPEPVWKTSMGNWSSCRPSAISAAAAMIASAFSGASNPRFLFTWAQAPFSRPSARIWVAQAAPGDRKVLYRALGLGAPQRFCRYPDLAHGVVLDAVFGVAGGAIGHRLVPCLLRVRTITAGDRRR